MGLTLQRCRAERRFDMLELFIFYAHQVDKFGCMQICGVKQNSQPVEKEGLSELLQLPCMRGKH